MAAFRERILVLDGAMGTMIQGRNLTAEDFGGPQMEGCNENLNLTRPDVIQAIHEAYLDAGADMISTNSFGVHPMFWPNMALRTRPRRSPPPPPDGAEPPPTGARRRSVRGSWSAQWAPAREPSRSPAVSPSTRCATATTPRPKG